MLMMDNRFQSRYSRIPIATSTKGISRASQDMPFVLMHYHKEFEVLIITSGKCVVNVNCDPCAAEAGDLVLIPPYAPHSGTVPAGEDFFHLCFCFDLSLLGDAELIQMLESGCLDTVRRVPAGTELSGVLLPMAQKIFDQCTARRNGWHLIVRGLLNEMFGELSQRNCFFSSQPKRRDVNFCVRLLKLLESHYAEQITSRDAAAFFSYTQSYFCRLFQDNFGMPFQRYLCEYRLAKVKILLSSSELSISDAAESVGFQSPGYFSRVFREEFGCTPVEFRQQQNTAVLPGTEKS
jgi:AraC-like DNA-binding protein